MKYVFYLGQMQEAWSSPPNNNILLREYNSSITTTRSRFVFFCTRSKAECSSHPFRGKLGQLFLCFAHTRNPALCRVGHFTFVECRRRCIMVCATIEDTNQMANFMNHNQSMTTLTMEESIRFVECRRRCIPLCASIEANDACELV